MALAPLQSRQAAANARGAPSFASSSRFSQSRASVAAACPSSSLLAQKKQQTLSSFSSPIRGGSLIAMSVGELVCWSRKGRAFANRERRERISCCTIQVDRFFFFLQPLLRLLLLFLFFQKKKTFSSRSPLLPLRRHHRRQGHSRHHPRRDRRRGQGARRSHGREGSGPGRRARRRPGRLGDVRSVESEGLRGGRDRVVRVLPARGRLAGGAAQGEREREYWGERERRTCSFSSPWRRERGRRERENETKSTLYISARAPPTRDGFPVSFPLCALGGYAEVRERTKNWRSRQKKRFPFFPPRRGASARAPDNKKRKKKRNKMSLSKRPPFLIIPDRSSPTSTPTPRSTASSSSSLFPNTSTRQRS